MQENKIEFELHDKAAFIDEACHTGCPGSQSINMRKISLNDAEEIGGRQSYLTHWPIQLHLVSPHANYYKNSDLVLAADCVGFSYPDFHKDFLKGKSLAIACPKLDTNKEVYLQKLISMINDAHIKSITVLIMQVPCCSGLLHLAQQAVASTDYDIPIKSIVIRINGKILKKLEVTH